MKKFLSILLLSVLFQSAYSFNLCSPFDSDYSKYAYLNDLSEEEIVKEIVDNTYEEEIGIVSWIKNIISFTRKVRSKKVDQVVSRIIVWDRKLSDEKTIENNINNLINLILHGLYKVAENSGKELEEEGIYNFADFLEKFGSDFADEETVEDFTKSFDNQNPLFYAMAIDNEILSKVFLDKGIKLQDCLYEKGFYYNYSGQKDFFEGPILIVLAGIGYNSFNLFLDNYCIDINATIIDDGDEEFRLIELAVMQSHGDIVKRLLDQGANNKRYEGEEGVLYCGALLTAVSLNDFDMVKLLVDNGVDVNDYNEDGSALSIAIENNSINIAKYLMEKGAYVEEQFLFFDCDDELKENMTNVLESEYNISALHIASLLGQVDKVKELLDKGFDSNVKDINGRTPLHVVIGNSSYIKSDFDSFRLDIENSASFQDYIDILDLLIKNGANVNEVDLRGNTPLIYAADMFSGFSFFNYLLKNGADIKIINDKGFSALAFIAKHFRYRNLFLNLDELISIEDYSNFNLAYYMSVFYGNYFLQDSYFPIIYDEYSKKLIEEVFDNDSLNNRYYRDGLNLLHVAIVFSNEFMINYWLENGFDINSVDLEGKSALFFVKNIDMAKNVLGLGVDFKIKDFEGRTAIDYLKELGLSEVVEFLESYVDSNID